MNAIRSYLMESHRLPAFTQDSLRYHEKVPFGGNGRYTVRQKKHISPCNLDINIAAERVAPGGTTRCYPCSSEKTFPNRAMHSLLLTALKFDLQVLFTLTFLTGILKCAILLVIASTNCMLSDRLHIHSLICF